MTPIVREVRDALWKQLIAEVTAGRLRTFQVRMDESFDCRADVSGSLWLSTMAEGIANDLKDAGFLKRDNAK